MTDLVPRSSGALSPRTTRRLSRSLATLQAGTALDAAHIDSVAELQAVKADAIAQVGAHAMQSLALVTQMEHQLAQTVPLAASRLQAIGDMTALAMTDIVADTARRVKRC